MSENINPRKEDRLYIIIRLQSVSLFSRSHLQCPNIVQFFGAFSEDDRFGIIIEYLPNGNLNDLLHTHNVELEKLQKVKIVSPPIHDVQCISHLSIHVLLLVTLIYHTH